MLDELLEFRRMCQVFGIFNLAMGIFCVASIRLSEVIFYLESTEMVTGGRL